MEAGTPLDLGAIARIVEGELTGAPGLARSFAIDSRAVAAGSLFFALKGERTDGHSYLDEVHGRGAAGAVVGRDAKAPEGLAVVRVADPHQALIRLGRHFRSAWPLRVVGITGSAGKTTTKDFAASLLATRGPVFRSEGNLNSTIGLPLTLCGRRPDQALAVLELGMSTPGELRRVADIASPDVAVITNVGLAHVGNFRSAEEVAHEKAQILAGLRPGGTFVANADDGRVAAIRERFAGPSVSFGVRRRADLRATHIQPLGLQGTRFRLAYGGKEIDAWLGLVGTHHVLNALAALAVAHALELDVPSLVASLGSLTTAEHRGRVLSLAGEVLVLDDCYNSNPAALATALDALASLPARRRVAIIGDMRELGSYAEVCHREAGRQAALRADLVYGVGPESAALVEEALATGSRQALHLPDARTAASAIPPAIRDGDAVLVKASRGIGLEVVVAALQAARS